ncbi:hypothetical protein KC333_g1628 [Hortaea werneckii]|nr:hypothetical protein KC333_g1628 [Hortaea werneckii]KAI7322313.1 hypothetical protein KC326_g1880 [Hortaea werneckii]
MDDEAFKNYFRHPAYFGWNLAHTIFMILAWCIALPVAIMLRVAGSRYHLRAQTIFHGLNGVGIITAIVYDSLTPELYPHDSHRGMGWATVSLAVIWTIASFFIAYCETRSTPLLGREEFQTCRERVAYSYHGVSRGYSTDSYQQSTATMSQKPAENPSNQEDDSYSSNDRNSEAEERGYLLNDSHRTQIQRILSLSNDAAQRTTTTVIRITPELLEEILLPLGFTALITGLIVTGGLFRTGEMLNGLAHMIKGGIFFWYGILTFGRWMGAFAAVGWAWNIRPSQSQQQQQQEGRRIGMVRWEEKVPSAEFVESFVIWLYGASNVFLEHLSGWGGEWTARDLEHVSITLLFFGGGMLGMVVESKWVGPPPTMAATTVVEGFPGDEEEPHRRKSPAYLGAGAEGYAEEHHIHERHRATSRRRIPLNPMPALTIMLLGTMMAAHHQASEVSTKLHSQWGNLFTAFALARGVTYITLYLKPPTSSHPSRPPTEIITSFCLCAGGLVFMTSASEVVATIEANGLDASVVSMVCMGLTCVILAWEIVLYGIKGWAVRRERERGGGGANNRLPVANSQYV